MQSKVPAARSAFHPWLRIPHWLFEYIGRRVKTGHESATIDRFFTSRHVRDLRVIIVVALGAVLLVLVFGFALSFENELDKFLSPPQQLAATTTSQQNPTMDASGTARGIDPHVRLAFATVAGFLTFFAPVLGAFAAIVAWAYQAGSARLGIVDLFACEISTLCRVGTVLDTVQHFIDVLEHDPLHASADSTAAPAWANKFTSTENYFPVFENNTKDLQSLEADVVINIASFYTYMKAVRDSMRALPDNQSPPTDIATKLRHDAMRDVIYLIYLGFESARKAIGDLVEFEPQEAERTAVILLSEFAAYGFLRCEFSQEDDVRCKRLKLREPEYQRLVPRLCSRIEHGWKGNRSADWEPAWLLLPELNKRYDGAIAAAAKALSSQSHDAQSSVAA